MMRILASWLALALTPSVALANLGTLGDLQCNGLDRGGGCVVGVEGACGEGDGPAICVLDPGRDDGEGICAPLGEILCDAGDGCPPGTSPFRRDDLDFDICLPNRGPGDCDLDAVNLDDAGCARPNGDCDQDDIANAFDNCVCRSNEGQDDFDCDGVGQACDGGCAVQGAAGDGAGDLSSGANLGGGCCSYDVDGSGAVDGGDVEAYRDRGCFCNHDGVHCDGALLDCFVEGGDGDADADADADSDSDADADADGDDDADADTDGDGDSDADGDGGDDDDDIAPLEFHGGGGCRCALAPARGDAALFALVAALALALVLSRRR